MSAPDTTETTANPSENTPSDPKMTEYYQLQRNLYLVMLGLTVVIFASVWVAYSLPTALNYLLGSCAGLLYFRRLARDIEGMGNGGFQLGGARLGIFIAVMIIATQIKTLSILPVFLGFLTYKAAIIVYVIQTTLFQE
ncbi:ATP synthase I chain [Dactylococcopsis salina PCC 8305]|uniref:ATP synthase I chain n=2 Tax=Dactylococcopsis salina TaxID=292566 RepID=K9Z011_DACS8|nr:ATP synthase I chain [Dactylococcopsis salina PCC 8305]